jgi:hypothetical protein
MALTYSETAARAIALHPGTIATRDDFYRLYRRLIEANAPIQDAQVAAGAIARWRHERVPPNATQKRSIAYLKDVLERLNLYVKDWSQHDFH